MNAFVRILMLAPILLGGCRATQDVAATSYHVTRGAAVGSYKVARAVAVGFVSCCQCSGALCDAEARQ